MNSYQALLDAVKEIPKQVESVDGREIFKTFGICSLLDHVIRFSLLADANPILNDDEWVDSVLWSAFSRWPEFSGEVGFPVRAPGSDNVFCAMSAYHQLDKWAGEYGDARRRLLQFLIEDLTARAAEEEAWAQLSDQSVEDSAE